MRAFRSDSVGNLRLVLLEGNMRLLANIRFVPIVLIGLLALAFGALNGVLMCLSPRHHAAFVRWYSRLGAQVSGVDSGAQIELRLAGLGLVAVSIFLGWKL